MELTDNEIKTALKCCFGGGEADCENCPNSTTCGEIDVVESIINLIDRRDAEIERLNETLDNIIRFLPACTDCEGKTPYGERTEKCVFEIDPSYCGKKAYELFVKMRTELETAKAEARKEFAERLVAIYENDKTYDRPNAHTLVMTLFRNIDNLLKEMERENDR